jgi:hydroxyacylglutathione hydrolase
MNEAITTITLPLPLGMGSVNCYLINTNSGTVLIDTGGTNGREYLLQALENAGCRAGDLKLIILTHGDFDHSGNAAYLRSQYDVKIAMHPEDSGMVQHGDMFFSRKRPNFLIRKLVPLFTGLKESDRFEPDIVLNKNYDLSPFGLQAKIIELPGHSGGSIGILTASGNFFCGDLFENNKKPQLNRLIDDSKAMLSSAASLLDEEISRVFPGHGKPFLMEQLA